MVILGVALLAVGPPITAYVVSRTTGPGCSAREPCAAALPFYLNPFFYLGLLALALGVLLVSDGIASRVHARARTPRSGGGETP